MLVWLLAYGCNGGSTAALRGHSQVSNPPLTGVWDLTLTLERPYSLTLTNPPARRICGTIGFVDGVEAENGDGDRESAGVYHAALSRIGLDWLDDSKFPSAIARQRRIREANSDPADSVAITLNPGSQEHIELRGVYRLAVIGGDWMAQSARGAASGLFTLRPHAAGRESPTC